MKMNRRNFITSLAASAGLIAMPEPVRRYWQVPRGAPVGNGNALYRQEVTISGTRDYDGDYQSFELPDDLPTVVHSGSSVSDVGDDHARIEIYTADDLPRILQSGTEYVFKASMAVDWGKHRLERRA